MQYYPSILNKFACAISNNFKYISFLCAWIVHERQEVVSIFHAKQVILRSSVYSLVIAREKGDNRDAQSQTAKIKELTNNQTKTPNGVKTITLSLGNRH